MIKSYFAITDKGPYFNVNQDSFLVNVEHGLFGIIDSFGGTGIGDVLSKNLCAHVEKVFSSATHDQDATLKYYFDPHRTMECNFLVNGLLSFHDSLVAENDSKSIYQRAGASFVFMIQKSDRVTLVSVGNTSALLIRKGHIKKLVLEDECFCYEEENDFIAPNQWTKSGVGLFSPLTPFIREFRVFPGDNILLASRGAVFKITETQLSEIISVSRPKEIVQSLLLLSNEHGNRDNQTAIAMRF